MRKLICKYFFLLLVTSVHVKICGQVNYVQNPSFEELDTCSLNGFNPPPRTWDTLRNGGGGWPQICSLCGSYFLTVPTTGFASYQVARTGNNYTFFSVWTAATISPGYTHERSYIQNELSGTLKQGHTYCVTFYTSLMNESKYSITEIGAYLDDGSIATIPWGVCTQSPQVKSLVGVLMTDTLGWMKVQGSFVANGTEKYLTLGNFKTTAATTRSIMPTSPTFTYQRNLADYYFDDVSVIDVDLPAYAGGTKTYFVGDSVFIGRTREVGLDDACTWYKLPNSILAYDTAKAGIWVKPIGTETYVVRQEICGTVKWDTVYVYPDAVGVKEKFLLESALVIFPVPASNTMYLKLKNGAEQITQLSIYNNLGQIVLSKEIQLSEEATEIDVQALPSGLYTLQLRQTSLGVNRRKIMIE